MMALAIELARKGQYTTRPNPNVGCVILDANSVKVGEGWHHVAGGPHAEIHALAQAQEKARGGTAYVTLEPCSHYGRTPPCAEALINAGVSRVVCAMMDPNPQVAGKGLEMLRHAGITTDNGLMAEASENLNQGFLKRMRTGLPYVRLKLAASLDGKIALANGKSQWITGPLARQDVQDYRASHCAILSGSGTVMADNPSLNVRYQELNQSKVHLSESDVRQPLRVIVDSRNQLSAQTRLFSLKGESLVANLSVNPSIPEHVAQWQAPPKDNKVDLSALMQHLAQSQINQVWVEGGSGLAGALIQQNLVDELILYQSPQLLGDKGQDLIRLPELTDLQQAIKLEPQQVEKVGNDLKLVFGIH